MRLKQITKLLFIFLSVFALSSCNDSTTEYDTSGLSGDSQISNFVIAAKPYTAIDTVNYPYLAKARFSIDQRSRLIYNADSLPYQTTLRKCAVTLSYAAGSVGKVELIYPKDSIVDWNSSDSVDFSTYLYPQFRITPLNGKEPRLYTIKILVHKEDPDTLVWKENVATGYPTSFNNQKTLLADGTFYTFTAGTDNKVYLSTANKPAKAEVALSYGINAAVSGLDASTLILESITFFNDKFYAVDKNKQGYVASLNGTSWSKDGISNNVTNIVGVVPTLDAATDLLLVVTGDQLATTTDLKTLNPKSAIDGDFPVSGYSSLTHNDRSNLNNCVLTVTKYIGSLGYVKTWSIKTTSDNSLQIASNQSNPVIPKKEGIATFSYNGYMYALTGNSLYKTVSYGYKWTTAPNKEKLDTRMPKASGQSVIVDDKNYIWVFGGVPDSGNTPIQKVWIGRINKLRTNL